MNAFTAPVAVSPLAEVASRAVAVSKGKSAAVAFADRSLHPRFGCKGKGAAVWLQGLGLPIPVAANRWLALPDGGLIARLGNTEFLVEGDAALVERLQGSAVPAGVAFVLRQDAALELSGSGLAELLLQTCSFNFAALNLAESPVVLTSMAGIGVTVIPEAERYRVWCDGTYGAALWETLHEVVTG
jgi:sarcosine oxidase subunit gamma